jgi:hypothetical protein
MLRSIRPLVLRLFVAGPPFARGLPDMSQSTTFEATSEVLIIKTSSVRGDEPTLEMRPACGYPPDGEQLGTAEYMDDDKDTAILLWAVDRSICDEDTKG